MRCYTCAYKRIEGETNMEQHKELGYELAFKHVPKSVGSVAVRKTFVESAQQVHDHILSTEQSIDEVLAANTATMQHGQ